MTEQQAMRMALEALEGFIPYLPIEHDKPQCDRYDKAITALRQALEQQPSVVSIDTLQERVENSKQNRHEQQPADEPVAWMFQHEETGRMNYVSNDGMNSPEFFMRMNQRYTLVCALYTRPQPAAWVWLTDEEIQEIALELPMDAVRIAEAALRSKNG